MAGRTVDLVPSAFFHGMESLKGKTMVAATFELWTEKETANYLKVKRQTLTAWRHHGRHDLPFVRVGNSIRYRTEDIEAWLRSRTQSST